MIKDFFKDRIVDWDSVKGLSVTFGLIFLFIGYVALIAYCMASEHFIIGVWLFLFPMFASMVWMIFMLCFPKNLVVAQERREQKKRRKKEKAALKEEKEFELKQKLNGRGLLWN